MNNIKERKRGNSYLRIDRNKQKDPSVGIKENRREGLHERPMGTLPFVVITSLQRDAVLTRIKSSSPIQISE